jgi:hypothetical protein
VAETYIQNGNVRLPPQYLLLRRGRRDLQGLRQLGRGKLHLSGRFTPFTRPCLGMSGFELAQSNAGRSANATDPGCVKTRRLL